ncbi:hypothetical protein ACFQH6_00890 [Halobacteriaceae archaeon GCM10025711]
MAESESAGGLDALFRLLVAYRMVVYLGGLVAIALPIVLARGAGVTVPAGARTAIVVVSLGLMILTYLGERRLGVGGGNRTGDAGEQYSLRTRLAVTLAVVGVVVGIYVALEMNLLLGVLFVGGAYLFGVIAFRRNDAREAGR